MFARLATLQAVVHVSAAMVAGLVCTTASAPFENLKTLMQVAKSKGEGPGGRTGGLGGKNEETLTGAWRSILREGGARGLFRGWTPLYVRQAPHTLVVFVVLEQMRALLGVEFRS